MSRGPVQSGKNPLIPRKMQMFGFGRFPVAIFAHLVARPEVSFTKLVSSPALIPPKAQQRFPCVLQSPREAEPCAKRHVQGHAGGRGHKGDARAAWSGPGGAKEADPSTPEPGMGEGISNWQRGLGCPFGGVVFNCTGCRFRGRAARGPYLCFHHFSFWEMKLKIPSQQLQRKKKLVPYHYLTCTAKN